MALNFSLINLQASAAVYNSYLTDEVIADLSGAFGAYLQASPAATVEAALMFNGVLSTAFIAQPDGANGSNFLAGTLCVLFDNTVVDALPRSSGYRIVVRITDNAVQQTFVTFVTCNLLNI